VNGVSHHVDRDDGGVVRASAPAVVVSILVKPGDTVAAGARLAVLEAMKMETQIVAPFAGKVRQVMIIPNVQVDTGAALLQIDAIAVAMRSWMRSASTLALRSPRISMPRCQAICGDRSLDELRQLMLGFDVDPKQTGRLLTEWNESAPWTATK
jgi:hypothetical protein